MKHFNGYMVILYDALMFENDRCSVNYVMIPASDERNFVKLCWLLTMRSEKLKTCLKLFETEKGREGGETGGEGRR